MGDKGNAGANNLPTVYVVTYEDDFDLSVFSQVKYPNVRDILNVRLQRKEDSRDEV